ncbi:MAG: type 4a pilus biogenesis protein PilO [bacterium]|nr:type 4a pilus biogenesis protein PilO [bacterium]
MKTSSKRVISLLLSVVVFIAAVVVYSTFVVPEYNQVSALRGESQAKQQTLDQQRTILDKVSSLLTRYQSIPKLGEVVSLALPSDEDVAGAFQQIYTIASASGISIQQFSANTSLGLTSTKKGSSVVRSVGTAQLNLILSGTYESFKTFIEAAERNMRIMDITNVKVQSAARSSGNLFLFNLTINAYYQS